MQTKKHKIVYYWLLTGLVMVFFQIIIGGITRLTGSGLSITEWNVMMGTLPPLNDAHWQELFDKYKEFPQYKIMNSDMDLYGFKNIFWWEYIHRLWARLFAIVFIIPFIYFIYKKKIDQKLGSNLFMLFLFGALQGFVGWVMVASGLRDNPWVNPLNLSIHLLLALFLFSFLIRIIVGYKSEMDLENKLSESIEPQSTFELSKLLSALILLVFIQIYFGALMAGHKAALYYPTWPRIGSEWIPSNMNTYEPAWLNIFENKAMIHFIHRNFAYLLTVIFIGFWWISRNISSTKSFKQVLNFVPIIISTQVILGIITVINSLGKIPVLWGVLHQAVAIFLLGSLLYLKFRISVSKNNKLNF